MRSLATLGLVLALAVPARGAPLHGQAIDATNGDPLIGVTVVVASDDAGETAITDEEGRFALDVPAGRYVVTFYYGELTVERGDVWIGTDAPMTTLTQPIDTTIMRDDWGCDFGLPPLYDGLPADHATRAPRDTPLLRARDHRALAGLDARLSPSRSVTTIGGALRLPGAPAIATELVDTLETAGTSPPIARSGAAGGTVDASLVRGSNSPAGGVALELGPEARFVARQGGPIEKDHLWWSTGVVLERTSGRDDRSGRHGAQVLATLDLIPNDDDVALGAAGLATWTADGGRDLWADAQGRLRSDDARRELSFGITVESLATGTGAAPARLGALASPAAIERVAGRGALTLRRRWHGHHRATLGGELGLGHADALEHGDLRAFVGDEWTPRPSWTLTGGVRWDRRELGTARVDAVLPRLAVAWDPNDEGRRMWYATAERVGALDGERLGAWRAGAIAADQLSVGYVRDWLDPVRVALSVRARRAVTATDDAPLEAGAELAVRWLPQRRFAGELTASSLTRRLVAQASYTVTHTTSTTVAAVAEIAEHERHGGAALAWTVPDAVGPGVDLRVALELFDLHDADTRSGRLAMSAAW